MSLWKIGFAASAGAAWFAGMSAATAQTQAPAAPPAAARIVPDCKGPGSDGLVVCGRRERPLYRLPEQPEGFDPDGNVMSVARERHKLYEVGDTGIGSCSTVGPGGWTGCQFQRWKEERQQHAGSGSVAFRIGVGKQDLTKR